MQLDSQCQMSYSLDSLKGVFKGVISGITIEVSKGGILGV